ncbi:MAG: MFS transporter [Alphaproteobacteria bacterium]
MKQAFGFSTFGLFRGRIPLSAAFFSVILCLLLLSAATISFLALREFEHEVTPELDRKAQTVGDSVRAHVARAVSLGIPFSSLVGVEDYLDGVLAIQPEIQYIAITAPDGRIIYGRGGALDEARGDLTAHRAELRESLAAPDAVGRSRIVGRFFNTTLAIVLEERIIGFVHLGVDRAYLRNRMREIYYDVLVVTLVSLLVTFEILLILITVNVTVPIKLVHDLLDIVRRGDFSRVVDIRGRDEVAQFVTALNGSIAAIARRYSDIKREAAVLGSAAGRGAQAVLANLERRFRFATEEGPRPLSEISLVTVRTPLFIFIFAEEMSRSFFPLFVRDLYVPVPGVSEALVLSLPLSLFMLVVAIFTPVAGALADRLGSRHLLLLGLIPAVAGHLATALAVTVYDLLAWRSLSAIGYAAMFIGAQGFIARHTTAENRAGGMAVFVGAVIAAGICGTSIGGILAERIGYRPTFFLSAGLVVVSALFIAVYLPREAHAGATRRRTGWRDYLLVLGNGRMLVLLLFASIPTKLMLTGYLFFLVPLYLHELGNAQSMIGRLMMAYGLALIFLSPPVARLADRLRLHGVFVAAGGILGGLGAMIVHRWPTTDAVLIGIITLGLAHALNNAAQLAMVPEVARTECAAIGQTTVFGIYRLIERAGAVLGPIVAAAIVSRHGYPGAMAHMGLMTVGCGVVFAAYFALVRPAAASERA